MLSSELKDLAAVLAEKARTGAPARETITDHTIAFGWSTGAPPICAKFVDSARVDGLTFEGVRVGPSATPAAKVAEGAVKPSAVSLQSFSVNLEKFAGLAEFSLEQALSTTALLTALQSTIIGQALVAYDTSCVAILTADAGETASGDTWTAAILNGIAAVASNGQNPTTLLLSPADYASAVQDPGAAFSSDPANGITALFGLRIGVVVGAATGTAFVLDDQAAIAVEHISSPLVLLDPYHKADQNIARLVTDLVATFVVVQPGGICKITVVPVP